MTAGVRVVTALLAFALAAAGLSSCAALGRGSDDGEPPIPSEVVDDDEADGEGANDAEGEPLVAAFSWTIDYEDTGTTSCPVRDITFTDESEGEPSEWRWVFDDGTTSAEQDPVVSGAVAEATLTVTRGDETDSVTEEIFYAVC